MNKKPPLTPPKGEDLGINDKMNDSNKYALAEVSPWGRFRGAVSWQSWRAATRNPVEALRYE